MRIRLLSVMLACSLVATTSASAQSLGDSIAETVREATREALRWTTPEAYQGGREREKDKSGRTEQFSRKVKIARDGRLTLSNTAGDIIVTTGAGDEVSIEATKRARGGADLASVQIEVTDRAGRIDVRTSSTGLAGFGGGGVSVDFTITVPASVSVEAHSVTGDVKVSGVQGLVRAETVSGSITLAASPRVELAKSVSGDVDITGLSVDGEASATTVSGEIRAKGGRARALALTSVSGDIRITDLVCERLETKTVSGTVQIAGTLAKNGRYDLHSFSGEARLQLAGDPGFELNAKTFSGSIRSDWPLAGADAGGKSSRGTTMKHETIRATVGDGSATVTIQTFSGDIILSRR
jgi:DUF4097 and DUF4098 domain-containing protein YvlB